MPTDDRPNGPAVVWQRTYLEVIAESAADPYTSRLESNMRLLTQRLTWLDERSRSLAAENDALRRNLDQDTSRAESEARERANRIVAAAEERAAALNAATAEEVERQRVVIAKRARDLEQETLRRIAAVRQQVDEMGSGPAYPPPTGPPIAAGPPPAALTATPMTVDDERLEEMRERAAALEGEIAALEELRDSLVVGIREALIGLAEELNRAEAGPLAPLEDPSSRNVSGSDTSP